ncbi:DUF3383 family protein [Asaia sp. VD9]|uniref:DUF3383 family protein n=1 Tax=Asaia sp. VD9 TaxID=3081235 RepID=UPI00301B6245
MSAGLPVSDIVSVTVTLSPTAAGTRNFGALLVIGSSGVLGATENLRAYTSLAALAEDFGTTVPEYLAGDMFFSQSPQPSTLYVGEERQGEALTDTIARLASASGDWYGCVIALATAPADSAVVAAAQMIEGLSPSRTLFVTTQEAGAMDPTSTTDLAYLLKQANLSRTACQYSSSSPYAAASLFGRNATVDYTANNSVITLKFKSEPGVAAETLSQTQANALDAKNCNYFVNYQNGTAIIQQGVMSNGTFIDVRIGADAYQNSLQTAGFNRLYAATKIPQTDAGMTTLKADYDSVSQAYVANGFFAPGVWEGPPIGAINTGDTLTDGYYIYKPPIASQSAADRAARKAVTMQIACKLAGAVHSSNVLVNIVN